MKLKTTLFGNVYQFKDVKEVLAKANELRSGDVLAGVAAASSQERVAAKQVLSEMTVADIRNNPVIAYEDDCVTRLIQDDVNETAYNQIKNWSISELREYVLSDETSVDDIAFTRKGLTSEVVAAVAKICSNADLIYGAKKMPVIKKANTTIGIPGTFSARLQPNDTRDDVQSIAAQIYEGLSFGVGDAVIGVNPVTDDVENLSRVLDTIYGVIDKFNIPTQGCVLAHVTTQIEAIRRGAPGGLIFQSICGSEKGLKEFGVELAMLDEARAVGAEFNRIAGENCLYFETGQGSALSAGANFGADQVTMEARNYGLARHYDPFIVNTVARVCTGRAGPRPRTQALLRFLADHSRSKDTVLKEVPEEWVKAQGLLEVRSEISDKNLYLTRPDMGRRLCAEAVEALKAQCVANPDVQVVISDGLSTDAITVNYEEILPPLMAGLKQAGLKVGTPFFVRYGRVKIEDQIGEILGAKVVILLVGERPGLGQSESLSCYAVYSPRMATTVEADRTCISNIHQGGTPPVEAAAVIVDLAKRMLEQKASGINMTR
ncbi:TPA: ethanolamine ammonia-lyase subunit EutB [Escherichia coli]|nr:ethanolamine ammonia-lyase subunit EutB [Escherichia coli]HAL7940958.1 ethanolamine ammonia-lyase subunit EutB [Escherichia coli]